MRFNFKLIVALLTLCCIVFYQNCSNTDLFSNGDGIFEKPGSGPADGDGYTGKDPKTPGSGPADGDGYAGFQVVHPEASESGATFDVDIISETIDDTYMFEVIMGDADITVSSDGRSFEVHVDQNYIGNLQIRITSSTGEEEIIEIQIYLPNTITGASLPSSFGSRMSSAGNVTFISAQTAMVDGIANVGKVFVWVRRSDGSMVKTQGIKSPILQSDVVGTSVLFGVGLASQGKDLLVGTDRSNRVFYYYREADGKYRRRGEVKLPSPESQVDSSGQVLKTYSDPKRFGSTIHMMRYRLLVADQGRNVVHIYSRKVNPEAPSTFTYLYTLEQPEGYLGFGRRINYKDNILLVSGFKRNADQSNRGVVHVYRRITGNKFRYIQTIGPKSATANFGLVSAIESGKFFISQFGNARTPAAEEFVNQYRFDSTKKKYVVVQRIDRAVTKLAGFGQSLVLKGNKLYVGLPRAGTELFKVGGRVNIYESSSTGVSYLFKTHISPNLELHSNPRNMGFSMSASRSDLFIGIKNWEYGELHGNVYRVNIED